MRNMLLVARREFLVHVRSRGFIVSAIGTPLLLIVIWFSSGMMTTQAPSEHVATPEAPAVAEPTGPTGVIDQAGVLGQIELPSGLVRLASEEDAARALRQGELEAYVVVPVDYRETGTVRRVSLGLPRTDPQMGQFEYVLVTALLEGMPADLAARYTMPLGPYGLELAESPVAVATGQGVNIMPLMVVSAVMVPLFTAGGWLLRSLAQEKESRIMEVLLVSLHPRQLLTGKLLGVGALTLLQYLIWILLLAAATQLMGMSSPLAFAGMLLGREDLVLVVLFAVGGMVLYSALMAGLGALTPDVHGSQNWVFIVTLPMMIPFYFWLSLVQQPTSTLALVLSLFPFSAPLAMLLRIMVMQVPAWQITLSLGLIAVTAVLVVRLMSRLFRAQVLLSGEPLSVSRLMAALRQT